MIEPGAKNTHKAQEENVKRERRRRRRKKKETGDCLTAGGRSSVLKGLLENPPVVCGNARSELITDRAGPLVFQPCTRDAVATPPLASHKTNV